MENSIHNFTKKYPVTKTLRFELIPQGRTLEHIKAKGLLEKDQQRAKSYSKMKETIDGFHKYFIELAMSSVKLTRLEEFQKYYYPTADLKESKNFDNDFNKIKEELRKEIVKGFTTGEAKTIFERIDKKELITEELEKWIQNQKESDLYFDEDFKKFTTYFGGFHQNRKNIYSDKPQSTAIAYRIIHENLPKFLDNLKIFQKLKDVPEVYEKCIKLYRDIEEYLNITTIDEAFELSYFNEILTQKQIDVYNLIIGGRSIEDGKERIQGLNEYINLYNQVQQDKKMRLPKFKMMFKQILSDRESTSFLRDEFKDTEEKSASQIVLDAIYAYYTENLLVAKNLGQQESNSVFESLEALFNNLHNYNLNHIYLRNDGQLSTISQKVFGNYDLINTALDLYYRTTIDSEYERKYEKPSKRNKLESEKSQFLKQDYFPVGTIVNSIEQFLQQTEQQTKSSSSDHAELLLLYFKNALKLKSDGEPNVAPTLYQIVQQRFTEIKDLLITPYPELKKLHQDKKQIEKIKGFLDGIMDIYHHIKPFFVKGDASIEKDFEFYNTFQSLYEQLESIVPLYNKVRNFATQKPYSVEKIKLNFDNSQLLNGWDINKESDYLSTLLFRNDQYYLVIMDKKQNKIFKDFAQHQSGDCYQKLNLKLLPGPNKMLPKVFFSKKSIDFFAPTATILENYERETHKKGPNFSSDDCHTLIDFFKASIAKHDDWQKFNFNFSATESYPDLSYFYKEISQQGYKISFDPISVDYIDHHVEEGNLYLFKIHNKDFSEHSKGKANLHTYYWKALFDPKNLADVVYKLNGEAEIFYRKASLAKSDLVIHPANEKIAKKKNTNEFSKFEYDLIKDKRFATDKFQFHVPITMNFKADGVDYLNPNVLHFLRANSNVNVIGIDRGERHLIYITIVDSEGSILEQMSLNDIVNTYRSKQGESIEVRTNYRGLLEKREKERAEARVNWGAIENIKELKEGYISQVVHIIAEMMIKYNAIVVMEDLNMGFKRGRFKVEKQVYQKLEKMLIDKLNYLVFKSNDPDAPGGLYNALQLTNKFTSFKEMGKQSGFLFYVPAWNTSKIDPTTGFVNFFDTKYESVEKSQKFFSKFHSIHFNSSKGYFEFSFDYSDFTTRAEGTMTKWTLCTFGDRIVTFRNSEKLNQWDHKTVDLTTEMEDILGRYQIVYGDQGDIKDQIVAQTDRSFFVDFLKIFKLILQMRNSLPNSDVDYLISPVMNESTGLFFDSRENRAGLPDNADANGALHIAKKGLQWLSQIRAFSGDDWKKLDLDKTNKGWLNFIQNKPHIAIAHKK